MKSSASLLSPHSYCCLSKKQPTESTLLYLFPGRILDVEPALTFVQIISVLPWW